MTNAQQERCRSLNSVCWCLGIVVALQCVGNGGRYILSPIESESDIYGFLFFDMGLPEKLAQLVDDAGAVGCLFAAAVLVVNGLLLSRKPGEYRHESFGRRVVYFADTAGLAFVTVWTCALATTHMIRGGAFAELSLGEQAVRIGTPLALLLMLRSVVTSSSKSTIIATRVLLLATAVTFAVHGYLSLKLYGPFVDLILLSDLRLFHIGIEQATAEMMLRVIGWTDLVVAILLITTRSRVVAAYMMLWGLITISSRMTAFGVVAWPETLIRVANAGAPFALLLLYQHRFIHKNKDCESIRE